ncbi:MAG TPA: Gfo/Idh/MocA family oxidoreductase [Phycisphaerae bacterium]|nr:Gfo/Idh/MocA family oxidoreductase [Phycisphaerae bacterium]
MAVRLAILGVDPIQREWLEAVEALALEGRVELAGVGHRTLSLAKDTADFFRGVRAPVFDDLRMMLKEAAPQVILMDRPANATVEFLVACAEQGIGVLSLGPPVENVAEAQALAEALEPKTQLLYIWPRFADSEAYRRCTGADEFVRPIKFAAAAWLGMNYALAKTAHAEAGERAEAAGMAVRSLSVLAWDALATLIELIGMPASVYAAIRGTIGSGNTFADVSGAASLTLRFAEETAASVALSDRVPPPGRRDLLLLGQTGTVTLETNAYDFRDAEGRVIDSSAGAETGRGKLDPKAIAMETLRKFLDHFGQQPSPHRGWEHRLEEVAATMEAMIVSHRTGQAESPERFRGLRR